MRLYLIRHAESEHNVAQVYAGTTDSALTNHGVAQIERLAAHLRDCNVRFARVFSSPLQRARITAEGVAEATGCSSGVILDERLKEVYLGALEGQSWRGYAATARMVGQHASTSTGAGSDPSKDGDPSLSQESTASITSRLGAFVRDTLLPACAQVEETQRAEGNKDMSNDRITEDAIALVSHGMTLSSLWKTLLNQCRPSPQEACSSGWRPIGWANTGYLEVDLELLNSSRSSCKSVSESAEFPVSDWLVTVLGINQQTHLRGLQRTGGGIGSAKHDNSQRRLDGFLQKNWQTLVQKFSTRPDGQPMG